MTETNPVITSLPPAPLKKRFPFVRALIVIIFSFFLIAAAVAWQTGLLPSLNLSPGAAQAVVVARGTSHTLLLPHSEVPKSVELCRGLLPLNCEIIQNNVKGQAAEVAIPGGYPLGSALLRVNEPIAYGQSTRAILEVHLAIVNPVPADD